MSANMLQAALDLALEGFRVFPLEPGGKRPLTAHGCKDATRDEDQIREWWAAWPSANVGIAVDPGFMVLDVDSPEGEASLAKLEAANGALPVTREARTGRGRHLWFRVPAGHVARNRVAIAPGLDVRGPGGYVVGPGSIHANGTRYEWKRGEDYGAN